MWGYDYKKHRKCNEKDQKKVISSMADAQEYFDRINKEKEDRRVKWMLLILLIALIGVIILARQMHYKERQQEIKIEASE
jgi:hypothetical protein